MTEDELVQQNKGLVYQQVNRYKNHLSEDDYDDMVQAGFIGLLLGIRKFNVEKGFRFSTYVTWWIRQAVTRCFNHKDNIIWIPDNQYYQADAPQFTRVGLEDAEYSGACNLPEEFENTTALTRARALLPRDHQIVITLYYDEGLSLEEIGSKLKRSREAIRLRRDKALKKLKIYIESIERGEI